MNPLWNDEQESPLQHLRVVDLTLLLPGPFFTRILAQLGAEVIKVEGLPKGDPFRNLTESSAAIEWLSQGKKSVALDLRSAPGIDLVRRLAAESDVFVENFREGITDAMGLGYEALSALNPELLYVSLRGFSSPHATEAGHDLNFIAASGVGEWHLENGPTYATHWGDLVGGALVPAIRLLAHLANPERRGMHLVLSMEQGFRSLFVGRAYDALKARQLPEAQRPQFGLHTHAGAQVAHSRYYRCADGHWISLCAVQPRHWQMLCERWNKPDWSSRAHDPALVAELEAWFLTQPATHWDNGAGDRGCLVRVVPWAEHALSLPSPESLMNDPLGWAGFSSNAKLGAPPALGQHTLETLAALGVPPELREEFLKQAVAFAPGR